MSGFWQAGFWSAGFWADGFWGEEDVAVENSRGGRRRQHEAGQPTAEEVLARWELLDLRTHKPAAATDLPPPVADRLPATLPADAPLAGGHVEAIPLPSALLPGIEMLPAIPVVDMALPITLAQQRAALDAKRRQDAAALVLLLSEL